MADRQFDEAGEARDEGVLVGGLAALVPARLLVHTGTLARPGEPRPAAR